jgi:hypothetical protein
MSEQAATAPSGAGGERPPLDDIMLAMDVVDTLRRRERLVARELDELGREEDLKARLRRIYTQQGIEVPDRVIEQGVAALKEDRFTYKPPQGGLARRLALLYVRRGRWGKWLSGGLAAVVLAAGVNHFAFVAPDRALPAALTERHAQVAAIAVTEDGRLAARQILDAGETALRGQDLDAARAALQRLDELAGVLGQEYLIRIANRPGQPSGVLRIPDVNRKARNYYVVVEALSPAGRPVPVPIKSEETGETERVTVWGQRVDEATFEAVRRDKQDDGIIENDRFGYKTRGHLKPRYEMPTSGGAITRW